MYRAQVSNCNCCSSVRMSILGPLTENRPMSECQNALLFTVMNARCHLSEKGSCLGSYSCRSGCLSAFHKKESWTQEQQMALPAIALCLWITYTYIRQGKDSSQTQTNRQTGGTPSTVGSSMLGQLLVSYSPFNCILIHKTHFSNYETTLHRSL